MSWDRRLELSELAHEARFLADGLGVVAGIRLVRNDEREEVRADREVGVDLDPALQVAEVRVVRGPRTALDGLASIRSPSGRLTSSRVLGRNVPSIASNAGAVAAAHGFPPRHLCSRDHFRDAREPFELSSELPPALRVVVAAVELRK
jgi:hypothetical protein